MEFWTSPADWIDWKFQAFKPQTYDVSMITSEQKYGKGWDGGHKVALRVAGKDLRGTVSKDQVLENPSNPYWPYVISKLGSVTIEKPGTYTMELKPEIIESAGKFGLTLVSVTLTPRRVRP